MPHSNLDERARLLELEADLQRRSLTNSFDALRTARPVTYGLAAVALLSRLAAVRKARWLGYGILAGKFLLSKRGGQRASRASRS